MEAPPCLADTPQHGAALTTTSLQAPVTAIHFLSDEYLLMAVGPYLRVHDLTRRCTVHEVRVLDYGRVHGIVVAPIPGDAHDRWDVVCYGGKAAGLYHLRLAAGHDSEMSMPEITPIAPGLVQLPDWIMDCQWLYNTDSTAVPIELAFAFAHNDVAIYRVADWQPVHRARCDVQCIVYSARFFGRTRASLRVAVGTVFNQALVWDVGTARQGYDPTGHTPVIMSVRHTLVGHEGVIFRLRFSRDGNTLATVSDDRTIRLWELNAPSTCTPATTLYGHTARVWDCQILDDVLVSIAEDTACRVWSFNPAQFRKDTDDEPRPLAHWRGHRGKSVWSLAINPSRTVAATGGGDGGVRLWPLGDIRRAARTDESTLQTMNLPPLVAYAVADHSMAKPRADFIRNFAYLGDHRIVAATHYGYLLHYDYRNGLYHQLHYDPELAGYAMIDASSSNGQVAVCGSINGCILAVSIPTYPANADSATVSVVPPFAPLSLRVATTQIFDVQVHTDPADSRYLHIFATVLNKPIKWLQLDLRSPSEPVLRHAFDLVLPTATLPTCFHWAANRQILLAGSREGALVAYDVPAFSRGPATSEKYEPLSLHPLLNLRRLHGKDTLTCLHVPSVPNPLGPDRQLRVYSGGRDGVVRQLDLSFTPGHLAAASPNHSPSPVDPHLLVVDATVPVRQLLVHTAAGHPVTARISLVHQERVTKGWIEGLTAVDGQLLISVFYRKRFVVVNGTHHYDQLAIPCGGGHRRWYFRTADAALDRAAFVFLRRQQVVAHFAPDRPARATLVDEPVVQPAFHGREVRCLAFAPSTLVVLPGETHGATRLLAAGGEDGVLSLSRVGPASATTASRDAFRVLATVRRHNSVLKALAWAPCSVLNPATHYLYTAGGHQELRCWAVHAATPGQPTGFPVDKKKDEDSENDVSEDLRCLEVAVATTETDIGIRIMNLVVFTVPSDHDTQDPTLTHFIAATYSDATVRLWVCRPTQHQFSLLAEDVVHHTHCVLSAAYQRVTLPSATSTLAACHILFTGATDGIIRAIDLTAPIQHYLQHGTSTSNPTVPIMPLDAPLLTIRAHQSGVNVLQVWRSAEHEPIPSLWLASGGDDNQLAAHRVEVMTSATQSAATTSLQVAASVRIPSAHASAIQGLEVIGDHQILTVATDQRINSWRIATSASAPSEIHLTGSTLSNVVDPGALAVTLCDNQWVVATAGIGLEVLQCDHQA
ncbi:WD repeat-containing protein 6 [Tieghemiomyces parasiticus]|uniref:WD repeat-containing protein 6 n=1 Tax=Tieghemiomyces parasiticus TaxID=78921 RepID=A0A9W8DLL9_9FUNG|nr:WD repeat-containing protein 6 [Tieghemiomyces parasiticus]